MAVVGHARNVKGRAFIAWSAGYIVFVLLGYLAGDEFVTAAGVSVWFPPAALTFAYLVRVGVAGAPIALITRIVAALWFMGPSFRLGNLLVTSTIVVAAYAGVTELVRRHLDIDGNHLRPVIVVVMGAAAAPLAAGSLVTAWVVATTTVPLDRWLDTLEGFWLGDASAVMTLAPLLVIGPQSLPRRRRGDVASRRSVLIQLLAISVVAWIAVAPDPSNPQLYLTFVPLAWIAASYGLSATTVSLAATGTLVPVFLLARDVTEAQMSKVQLFLVVYALTGLVLGASESERRGAREALEASERRLRREHRTTQIAERRFRTSFEAAPIGIALVGTDGRFLRVNAALCSILGYTADELIGTSFIELTHPDDVAADLAMVHQVMAGELEGYSMEKRYLHRDGRVVTAQLDVSLVRDDDGEPVHFISQIQDVSMRSAMVASLQAAEATQRACLNALEQGIALVDVGGKVQLLNPSGRRILGYDAVELTRRLTADEWNLFTEDGEPVPSNELPIAEAKRTGQPVQDRIVCWRGPDEQTIVLRVAAEPVHDDDGVLTAVVIAFADITAQRQAERAEKEALDRLEWQAYHDPLTALGNRTLLLEHLHRALEDRRGSGLTALFFLDLDGFKLINDTMGHAAGDELLVGVAARLDRAVRADDVVSRFGGDEFVVLARELSSPEAIEALAVRISDELAAPISLSTGPVTVSASIGIAVAGEDHTPDTLLADADAALYRAKQSGRGRHELITT